MSRKPVLGKGLAALLPTSAAVASNGNDDDKGLKHVAIRNIDVNTYQPRTTFDEVKLNELAESIRVSGVLQPLLVRPKAGGRYELIAGERRFRASKMVGLLEVPVVIRDVSDEESLELALVENIQRDELNAIELAVAFEQLRTQFGYSHEQVSARVGKDRSTVTNHLRLLSLPAELQEAVVGQKLSMGHARAILGLKTEAEMLAAYEMVVSKGLSVRQTEKLVREAKEKGKKKNKQMKLKVSPEIKSVTERLERRYSTKVKVTQKGKGGQISLQYSSLDELNRLLDSLL